MALARELTHQIRVGDVAIGGGAPVSVQSMTNTPTIDAAATISQIERLAEVGCEIARVAIPHPDALGGFEAICASSPLPVVADIHFDHQLAIEAIRRGADGIRINPGNIGSMAKVDKVIDVAGERGVPIRIGVNAGSLAPDVADHDDLSLSEKLVASAMTFVEHFRSRGFADVVCSAKAHDVLTTLETYRRLSSLMPDVPLHLGVTEAGTIRQGTVKSSVGLGILLSEGIGDTMRVSLTADPVEEPPVAWDILSSLSIRRRTPEIVSCPTCGRCQVDLVGMAEEVSERLAHVSAPISVAIMGCVVNGPGEARDADIGVACGRGQGLLFQGGEVLRKVPEDRIVDELMEEIDARFCQGE
ncbi:MAG: flavodoxin-dependent (E)-4-hydroxy-3-methylbut-2-enyl-diphosphate synthase [Atopobiaceae bacterium]|nr:flavodoxin-dependent (E)-4-hydroxy-3-methylbut-2-enyl-diphosphate synthase [Atopobiaceae bacterium]MCI2173185.1 flavodoxin-dependent (E)-4-hydroxy-3-methylbut-2-enyl-diphosphate synthase [Atopobiaceae bacterium]MCI2208278.1 flavodoxin-dependent (E)-4-hydroxy-3-methylbut-2-enyl-diphosphate synthase [Atopobiaceae bacterium]